MLCLLLFSMSAINPHAGRSCTWGQCSSSLGEGRELSFLVPEVSTSWVSQTAGSERDQESWRIFAGLRPSRCNIEFYALFFTQSTTWYDFLSQKLHQDCIMSSSSNKDPIHEVNECRREIEKILRSITSPKSSRTKRCRRDLSTQMRKDNYERMMVRLKIKFNQVLARLFARYNDLGVYDKIAYDIMRIFHTIQEKYHIEKDNLYFAVRCAVLPVICQILDDEDIGKRAYEKQQLRKYFLNKLMNADRIDSYCPMSIPSDSDTSFTTGDISIDVCTGDPVDLDRGQHSEVQEGRRLIPSGVTLEIIDILIGALGKLSKTVSSREQRLCDTIHHTINVTFLIDVLDQYLDSIKVEIENEMLNNINSNIDTSLLYSAVEKYERDLIDHLGMFDMDSEMTILRDQLDTLLFKMITLKPMLKRR